MRNDIVKKLNELLTENKVIYVLKGFNSINLNGIRLNHIFDMNLYDKVCEANNINNKTFVNKYLTWLVGEESYYCYYEELFYWEKCNVFGIIENNDYRIIVIDIGCFNFYYPAFTSQKTDEIIELFNRDSSEKNIYQILYTEYDRSGDNSYICYNKLDNSDKCFEIKLMDLIGSDYLKYNYSDVSSIEMLDNCSSSMLVNIFNEFIKNNINTIKYINVENKKDHYNEKFLKFMNSFGCEIIEEKDQRTFEDPELIDEYRKILKRKNPEYDFRNFKIYKNPFESNEKIEISQSIIIDYIYQNVIKAQDGKDFRDIFLTAPTGAGKSVLFQIPAILAAEKNNLVTIVISPLIGLMNDQVENIKAMTNCARTINSDYTPYDKEEIKQGLKSGKYSIIYLSPETLLSNYDIKSIIGDRKIGLLVIDEAHTVATWGKNFRPDYWYLGEYIEKLRHKMEYNFPIATFTATSTISTGIDDMYHDIVESLNMSCEPFIGDVKRTNIKFEINNCIKDHAYKEEKEQKVIEKVKELANSGERSLVYFPFVSELLNISKSVYETGKVSTYYGSADKLVKNSALEDIRTGKRNVVLATKAFGMGIDVDHILNVYHFAPTGNLADYVQEIGRAARKPDEIGIASTDYYKEDFKYINKLYGISQINTYYIKGVISKILYKYNIENKRNFLISSEDFSHIFRANNDEEIDSNLKATIIAIKRDFKYTENYVPLIFKPRSMFTKGLFYITDAKMPLVAEYGWNKYLELKYSGEQLSNMDADECKHIYKANVYEFDFKKCWEDNYNDRMSGITFGNFKRLFFANELPDGKDRSFMMDRMVMKVETKNGLKFGEILNIFYSKMDAVKKMFDAMKQSSRHYSIDDMVELYLKYDTKISSSFAKGFFDSLINLLITIEDKESVKFCDFNSSTQKYCIKNVGYFRKIEKIKNSIKYFVLNYEQENNRIAIVDGAKNVSRENYLVVSVQILEMFGLVNYNFQAGNKPEFFIRVNSETALRKIVEDKNYHSMTLDSISKMHYDSNKYMNYFFSILNNDEDRWDFIEDYFLGRIDEKWNVPDIGEKIIKSESVETKTDTAKIPFENGKEGIMIYKVYDYEFEEENKYYISKNEISELNNEEYYCLNPETALAKKLIEIIVDDEFYISNYKYKLLSVESINIK